VDRTVPVDRTVTVDRELVIECVTVTILELKIIREYLRRYWEDY
jgi:hypothetical protein